MKWYNSFTKRHCRWCQTVYTAKQPVDKDGFCSARCKQAHHRAYKKYVTGIGSNKSRSAGSRRTRK